MAAVGHSICARGQPVHLLPIVSKFSKSPSSWCTFDLIVVPYIILWTGVPAPLRPALGPAHLCKIIGQISRAFCLCPWSSFSPMLMNLLQVNEVGHLSGETNLSPNSIHWNHVPFVFLQKNDRKLRMNLSQIRCCPKCWNIWQDRVRIICELHPMAFRIPGLPITWPAVCWRPCPTPCI